MALLLTGLSFHRGVVGKALKGPICTTDFSGEYLLNISIISTISIFKISIIYSIGGVNVWEAGSSLDTVAATLAHELGHVLGMDHDTAACCPGHRWSVDIAA